jgi:hypothetical protein
MPFQKQVNLTQAPAVEGDFASANPRATVLAGPGGLVAGPAGVTVGRFAWVAADGKTVSNSGIAGTLPAGFVHREQQGLITRYLDESTMLVPQGFPITLHNQGDFWVKNSGSNASTINEAIYASYSDGSILAGSVGLPVVPSSVTATLGSTNTGALGATFTASAHAGDATRIDVTAVTGLLSIGDTIANVSGIAGSQTILSQDSGGTTGGAGTYVLSGTNTLSAASCTCFGNVVKITASTGLVSVGENIATVAAGFPASAVVTGIVSGGGLATAGVYTISVRGTSYVASATGLTTFGNFLNVTAITGTLAVGQPVTATGGIPAGSSIGGFLSGTLGGVGLYSLNIPGTAYTASGTVVITAGGINVTSFTAQSIAASGELVKISTWGV